MTLEELIEKLKTQTLEEIIDNFYLKTKKDNLVECFKNYVYFDDDLEQFLEDISSEIYKFKDYFIYIKSRYSGLEYKIPYTEKSNRFDLDLPFEIILDFSQIVPVELNTIHSLNLGFKIIRDGKVITLSPKEMSNFRFLNMALDGYNCLESYKNSGQYDKETETVIEKLMENQDICHDIEEEILDNVFTDNAEVNRDVIEYYIEQEMMKETV